MARIGYARVSSIDQDLDIQLAKLKAEGLLVRSEGTAAWLCFKAGDNLVLEQ